MDDIKRIVAKAWIEDNLKGLHSIGIEQDPVKDIMVKNIGESKKINAIKKYYGVGGGTFRISEMPEVLNEVHFENGVLIHGNNWVELYRFEWSEICDIYKEKYLI